jgi:hypothetical protein
VPKACLRVAIPKPFSPYDISPRGIFSWTENDDRFRRGIELLLYNAEILEDALATKVPSFYYAETA